MKAHSDGRLTNQDIVRLPLYAERSVSSVATSIQR